MVLATVRDQQAAFSRTTVRRLWGPNPNFETSPATAARDDYLPGPKFNWRSGWIFVLVPKTELFYNYWCSSSGVLQHYFLAPIRSGAPIARDFYEGIPDKRRFCASWVAHISLILGYVDSFEAWIGRAPGRFGGEQLPSLRDRRRLRRGYRIMAKQKLHSESHNCPLNVQSRDAP